MSVPDAAGGGDILSTCEMLKPLQASVWSHAKAIPLMRDLDNQLENSHQFLGRLFCPGPQQARW